MLLTLWPTNIQIVSDMPAIDLVVSSLPLCSDLGRRERSVFSFAFENKNEEFKGLRLALGICLLHNAVLMAATERTAQDLKTSNLAEVYKTSVLMNL